MIKDIRKIDQEGNEYLQEVVICDKCKNILEPKDYFYTIKLIGWRPVKMEPNHAYGISSEQKPWHMCTNCYQKMLAEFNGNMCNEIIDTSKGVKAPTSKFLQIRDNLNNAIRSNKGYDNSSMRAIGTSEVTCNINELQNAFGKLCELLHEIAVEDDSK